MNTPDQLLANLLADHKPNSLLLMGNTSLPALQHYQSEHPQLAITSLPLATDNSLANIDSRFDICLITPEFTQLPKPDATELLAGIRNRLCHVIYLFLQLNCNSEQQTVWSEGDLYGLGLKRIAQFNQDSEAGDARQLSCFGYEIESYIKKRDWNNSKYWANPENFGKYWW